MKEIFTFENESLYEIGVQLNELQFQGYEIYKMSHSSVLNKDGKVVYSCVVIASKIYHF